MDVLLTRAEDSLFTWVWSDEVLDEWEKVIVGDGKRTPESAASVAAAVRTHFGRYRIDPALYHEGDCSTLRGNAHVREQAPSAGP